MVVLLLDCNILLIIFVQTILKVLSSWILFLTSFAKRLRVQTAFRVRGHHSLYITCLLMIGHHRLPDHSFTWWWYWCWYGNPFNLEDS